MKLAPKLFARCMITAAALHATDAFAAPGQPLTASQAMDAGLEALAKGDNSGAIGAFRLAVQADPDDKAARRLLADALRRAEKCEDALTHYQILQALAPDDDARRGEVACLRAVNQLETAMRIARDVLARHPGPDPLGQWATSELAALQQQAGTALAPAPTPTAAEPETPDALEAQGDAMFAAGRYRDAAAWFGMAQEAAPTPQRQWKAAITLTGANAWLEALVATDQTLRLEPTHAGALKLRPVLAAWVRARGTSGNPVTMVPGGKSIRMVVLQALADGDDVLARQLLPLWRTGPEKGAVAELVQAELWIRDNRLADADKVLRAILAKTPGHPAAIKALAEVVVLRGEFAQARMMLNMPMAHTPAGTDPNADLYRFILRRHAEWQQQVRMAVDPGVKPLPALATQLAEMTPPPPPPPVEEVAPPSPPPPEPTVKKVAHKNVKWLHKRARKPAKAKKPAHQHAK